MFAAEVTRADHRASAHRDPPRGGVRSSLRRAGITIIATGPSDQRCARGRDRRLTGAERLFFYDSISPIVDADSVDHGHRLPRLALRQIARWHGDYLNCPFDRRNTSAFVDALLAAQAVDSHIAKMCRISKPACPSKNWPGADAIRCASVP
jgi:folate-dependent tRNA-U54 methylase TrmFO/GidA